MPCDHHRELRERARALRRAGWARADICRELGIKDNAAFAYWIKDIPAPPGARRRRKDPDVKARALALRLEGRSYGEIETILDVSRSTLSGWLKDVPLTEDHRRALDDRKRTAYQRRADSGHARRMAARERVVGAETRSFGSLSERELLVAGVVAYWAEGSKMKPWNPEERVRFINSDPMLIRLFLDWLDLMGVDGHRLVLRVSIHESADVRRAVSFWSEVTGVPEERFMRPTLKRHNPKTVRKNTGDTYVGCLTIDVRRSRDLYRRIDGLWRAIAGGAPTEVSEEALAYSA